MTCLGLEPGMVGTHKSTEPFCQPSVWCLKSKCLEQIVFAFIIIFKQNTKTNLYRSHSKICLWYWLYLGKELLAPLRSLSQGGTFVWDFFAAPKVRQKFVWISNLRPIFSTSSIFGRKKEEQEGLMARPQGQRLEKRKAQTAQSVTTMMLYATKRCQ